jgi:hypothetical protein
MAEHARPVAEQAQGAGVMPTEVERADWTRTQRRGMQALWRLAGWGSVATLALFVAVITAYSGTGWSGTGSSGTGSQRQPPLDQGAARPRAGDTDETRHLAETVRALAADRDQAFARIAALEHTLDGLTGSIKRAAQAQPTAQPVTALPPPDPAATTGAAPSRPEAPPIEVAISPASVPPPQPVVPQASLQQTAAGAAEAASRMAAITPTRPTLPGEPVTGGIGLDVGGAISYDGLRTLWQSTKTNDPGLLDDLYPVVAVRENSKTHGIDLRLLVGPIVDMETAAHLCATLIAAHRYCQPVAFDGQRLSLNDPPAGKLVPAHRPAPPKSDAAKPPDAKPADAKPGFFSLTR